MKKCSNYMLKMIKRYLKTETTNNNKVTLEHILLRRKIKEQIEREEVQKNEVKKKTIQESK